MFIRSTWEIPLWSSGYDSTHSLPRAWVQSLIGELRSHKPYNQQMIFFFLKKEEAHVLLGSKINDGNGQIAKEKCCLFMINWGGLRFVFLKMNCLFSASGNLGLMLSKVWQGP